MLAYEKRFSVGCWTAYVVSGCELKQRELEYGQ